MNLYKISIVLLVIFLTGCLDDDKYALDPGGYKNIIEFLDPSVPSNPAGAVYPVWTRVTEVQEAYEFEQTIAFSGPNDNNEDITLELAVDPAALQEYNLQMEEDLHGGLYTMMPDEYFTFTETTVTIPKGQKTATFKVTVYPELFDLTKTFALPIRIVSAPEGKLLSAHFSTALFAVVVKNMYDGVYEIIDGSITRNTVDGPDLTLGGDYDEGIEIELTTVNGNTVKLPDSPPLWKDGSGVGGIVGTIFVIDEATNQVTVSSSGNATLKNTPATTNVFKPADGDNPQEFELSFDWGSGATTRIISGLKLKYLRPRD